jgi:prepilin peptidase CpaA
MSGVLILVVIAVVVAAVGAVIDARTGHLPNWLTLGALGAAPVMWFVLGVQAEGVRTGVALLGTSLLGALLCAVGPAVAFFRGGLGGGDVKLLAMVGAFLGVEQGLEALLWTFVLGGCLGLITLIWQVGAWELARRTGRYLLALVKVGPTPPPESDRRLLQAKLYLGPCAPVAIAIVVFEMI